MSENSTVISRLSPSSEKRWPLARIWATRSGGTYSPNISASVRVSRASRRNPDSRFARRSSDSITRAGATATTARWLDQRYDATPTTAAASTRIPAAPASGRRHGSANTATSPATSAISAAISCAPAGTLSMSPSSMPVTRLAWISTPGKSGASGVDRRSWSPFAEVPTSTIAPANASGATRPSRMSAAAYERYEPGGPR